MDGLNIVTSIPARYDAASYVSPRGLLVENDGSLIFTDNYHYIGNLNQNGELSVFAGSEYVNGYADGTVREALFDFPSQLIKTQDGSYVIADTGNNCLRKINANGVVTTIAGNGTSGYKDGVGSSALLAGPIGIAVDVNDTIFFADLQNYLVRKLSTNGVITTVAGSPQQSGTLDGVGSNARFNILRSIAVNLVGDIFVADSVRIRKITSSGVVTSFAGSTSGFTDGLPGQFSYAGRMVFDDSENLWIADKTNNAIRKVTSSGVVSTLFGNGVGYVDGTFTSARISAPVAIAIDWLGNLFTASTNDGNIRKIYLNGIENLFLHCILKDFIFCALTGPGVCRVGFYFNGRNCQLAPAGIHFAFFQFLFEVIVEYLLCKSDLN